MSNYRHSLVRGGTWFFTVTLADRQSRGIITPPVTQRDLALVRISTLSPTMAIAW